MARTTQQDLSDALDLLNDLFRSVGSPRRYVLSHMPEGWRVQRAVGSGVTNVSDRLPAGQCYDYLLAMYDGARALRDDLENNRAQVEVAK